jgi:hypothetical protein
MCKTPWSLVQALKALTSTQGQLLEESCLPYSPEAASGSAAGATKACQRSCNNVAPELTITGGGSFVQTVLPDPVTVQQYIRRVGGVVTRFEVHTDFEGFFKANATAVYPGPGKGATYAVSRKGLRSTCLDIRHSTSCQPVMQYAIQPVQLLSVTWSGWDCCDGHATPSQLACLPAHFPACVPACSSPCLPSCPAVLPCRGVGGVRPAGRLLDRQELL